MNIKELTIVRIGLTEDEARELGKWLDNTVSDDGGIVDRLYDELNELGYVPGPEEAD